MHELIWVLGRSLYLFNPVYLRGSDTTLVKPSVSLPSATCCIALQLVHSHSPQLQQVSDGHFLPEIVEAPPIIWSIKVKATGAVLPKSRKR